MNKMLTIREVAVMFGMSYYEINRGIKKGLYPSIKIGEGRGKYLINPQQFANRLNEIALGNLVPVKQNSINVPKPNIVSYIPLKKENFDA